MEIHPEFFIWLGDNTPHDVWNLNKDEHMWGPRNITNLFAKSGYNTLGKMYPNIGNHEGMPCDQYDLDSDEHRWILGNITEMWKPWFTNECKD